jgi:hypothetical protein
MSQGTKWLGQCWRKVHYATEAEALGAAARTAASHGQGMDVYRCRYCGGGWLVGKVALRPRRAGPVARLGRPARVGWGDIKRRGL